MSAEVINAILESESGRIGPEVMKKTLHSSAWTSLVPVETWPEEMGEVIRMLTWERGRALNSGKTAIEKQTWTSVAASNGEAGGACLPPTTKVTTGTTLREYSLAHTAIESVDLCVNDLRGAFKRGVQLGALKEILAENTNQIVIERRRDLYRSLCEHKCVVTVDGPVTDTTWTVPGSNLAKLTQGVLNKFYSLINRLGGYNYPLDRVDGAPNYGLITSMEASEFIKQETGHRDAMIRSARVGELLKPLGVSFSFKGFSHIIDPIPPRFNIEESAWVEVDAWVPEEIESSGHGYKLVPNPDYDEASAEESFIFVPKVYSLLVPKAITTPGGGTSFEPQNYRGEWKWQNIKHRTENPDGTIGYFRGVYMDGAKPGMTELGVAIRHLRCDLPYSLSVCGS
jgi:hypothetical protein